MRTLSTMVRVLVMQAFVFARIFFIASMFLVLTLPEFAHSQAWIPAKGSGSVSLSYVYFNSGDHLFSVDLGNFESRGYVADGKRMNLGLTEAHTVIGTVDYGLPVNLALSASFAYVASRYVGNAPVNREIDDGEYHGTFQDGGMELRWRILTSPLVVTPFIGYGFPTSNYAANGHTAVGRGLNEGRIGLNVGRLLYPWISSVYVHAGYAFTYSEEVLSTNIQRSLINLEIGYFPTRWLTLSGAGSYQNTFGGLEWASGDPNKPCPHCGSGTNLVNQISAARFLILSLSAGFSLPYEFALYTVVSSMMWGENIEEGNQFTIGTSWSFATP